MEQGHCRLGEPEAALQLRLQRRGETSITLSTRAVKSGDSGTAAAVRIICALVVAMAGTIPLGTLDQMWTLAHQGREVLHISEQLARVPVSRFFGC